MFFFIRSESFKLEVDVLQIIIEYKKSHSYPPRGMTFLYRFSECLVDLFCKECIIH